MSTSDPSAHGSTCPWWLMYFADYRLRGLFQPTGPVIDEYVKPGHACLDMGCGMGYFSVPMAHRVGPHGRVTAVDLQPQMLKGLAKRASREGVIDRVSLRLSHEPDWRAPDNYDFILAFWMLHEVSGRAGLLKDFRNVLKPDGRFLLVEPRIHVGRNDWELSLRLAQEAGLHVLNEPSIRYSRAALFSRSQTR